MPEPRTAKLFKNGSSRAVRLPADFRFEGEEVYITSRATRQALRTTSNDQRTTEYIKYDTIHILRIHHRRSL